MIKKYFIILTVFLLSVNPIVNAETFDDSEVFHIAHPDWFLDTPFTDLSDAIKEAHSEGKQGLMILFTTNGCSYCDLFIRKSLNNPKIAAKVQQYFNSIGLEIFDDTGMTDPYGVDISVKDYAQKIRAEFSPTLVFYGKEGKLIQKVVGYQSPERFNKILDYITQKHFKTSNVNDYLKQFKNTTVKSNSYTELKQDPLFIKPPYILDRSRFAASQPMLVIFEKTGNKECNELHTAVLAKQDIRERLNKFEIARFDASDNNTPIITPNGSRLTPETWYKQNKFTRVPALMFFDEKGNNVLSTDALVLHQRMMNSINYVLERAYEKDWTYQRFARFKAIERNLNKKK